MKMFRRNEDAVSPVIGVILMVAITVILAAVIAAFVFGLGGQQVAAPTASITAANNPDTPNTVDMKIQHKGVDTLKGGDWKISVVQVGNPPTFVTSTSSATFAVGNQIVVTNTTDVGTITLTNSSLSSTGVGTAAFTTGGKYDVKLVHIPSNAMLLDTVVEVR
jgi:flagellin-like protein